LINLDKRHGKLGIIDRFIPDLTGEIVVITDANVILSSDAIKTIAAAYSDPSVGSVSGELAPFPPDDARNIDREISYRLFENRLKYLMSSLGSVIGAFGGFYSIRKTLFRRLGQRPVHDDVVLPLEVLAQGFKAIHVRQAIAYEETNPTIRSEYTRRVRMTALNLNTIPRLVKTAWHAGPMALYLAIGYKACRWISPYLLLVLFTSSLILSKISVVYSVVAIVFIGGLLLAAIGWIRDKWGVTRGGLTTDLFHFTTMNIAAFKGFLLWLKGVEKYWEPRAI
jgi:cellulose synthase/poly-beta-1,6-N-acetylglucosamine synthase-like glycosyltransferase